MHFPKHLPPGQEQQGRRPAVVVGLPGDVGASRFPMVVVVPLTSDKGEPWPRRAPRLYPVLAAGTAGLSNDSVCLIDQVRAVGLRRVTGYAGALPAAELKPILDGLRAMLRFDGAEDVALALERAGIACSAKPGDSEDARRVREMAGVPEDVRRRVAAAGSRALEVAGGSVLFFDAEGRYAGARPANGQDDASFSSPVAGGPAAGAQEREPAPEESP